MCISCGIPIYKNPPERHLDWAGGIRGSPENHLKAQRYFERMKMGSWSRSRHWKKLASEGLEIAQETRERICKVLSPDGRANPRNIILAPSASMSLFPYLVSRSRSRIRSFALLDRMSYAPLLSLVFALRYDLEGGKGKLKDVFSSTPDYYHMHITRQNYGEHLNNIHQIRTKTFIGGNNTDFCLLQLCQWSNFDIYEDTVIVDKRMLATSLNSMEDSIRATSKEKYDFPNHRRPSVEKRLISFLISGKETGPTRPILFADLVDGSGGIIGDFAGTLEFVSKYGGVTVLDASHVFGLWDILPEFSADIILGSSSKILAAEPTLGFAYVSDQVLQFIQENLLLHPFPFIPYAFQFHPDVLKEATGKRPDPDSIAKMTRWISLPEMESFRFALEKHGGEGSSKFRNRFFKTGSSIYRQFEQAFCGSDVVSLASGDCFSGEGHRALPYILLRFRSPHAKAGSGSGIPSSQVSDGSDPFRRLMEKLGSTGYLVKEYSLSLTLHNPEIGEKDSRLMRISWNPDIEPDIVGFIGVISGWIREEY